MGCRHFIRVDSGFTGGAKRLTDTEVHDNHGPDDAIGGVGYLAKIQCRELPNLMLYLVACMGPRSTQCTPIFPLPHNHVYIIS